MFLLFGTMGGGQSLMDGANAARADLGSSSDERLRAEIAVHLHLAQGSAPSVSNRELLERAYTEADSNTDGKLDFAEFAAIASAIGLGVSEAQLRTAFGRVSRAGSEPTRMQPYPSCWLTRAPIPLVTVRCGQRWPHHVHGGGGFCRADAGLT